jgi:hypothetical protein
MGRSEAEGALGTFQIYAVRRCIAGAELGLFTEEEGDLALTGDLLRRMARNRADFTLTSGARR